MKFFSVKSNVKDRERVPKIQYLDKEKLQTRNLSTKKVAKIWRELKNVLILQRKSPKGSKKLLQ